MQARVRVLAAMTVVVGCAPARSPPVAHRVHGPITGIDHVSFLVSDLEAARAFYRDLLGLIEVAPVHGGRGATSSRAAFQVGQRQRIEVEVGPAGSDGRLGHVAFAARGLPAGPWSSLHDPDGHRVEIAGAARANQAAEAVARAEDAPPYQRIAHVGILVHSLSAALGFYRGQLEFQEFWRGGSQPDRLDWVNLRTLAGEDYLELMLYGELPAPADRGGKNHVCIFVADVAAAARLIEARPARRAYARPLEVKIGRNRKRQLNLFDPDGTRVELMEPQTVDGQPVPSSTAPPPRP